MGSTIGLNLSITGKESMSNNKPNHSTSSKGKTDDVNFIFAHLGISTQGTIAGTVGAVEGAQRHVNDWKKRGFPESRQIIVEIDSRMFKPLAAWAEKTGYRGEVFLGSMRDCIKNHSEITEIDFDVLSFNQESLDTLFTIAHRRIRKFSCTFQTRGRTEFLVSLAKKLGVSRRRATKGDSLGKLCYDNKEIIEKQINQIFGTYYNVSRPNGYQGVSSLCEEGLRSYKGKTCGQPMVTFCLREKELI
jgi:hypothetical protein